jgi:hypothetical protein
MSPENDDGDARRDHTATERPADDAPEHDDDSEESGGPYGNPTVDEESLRKQQEDAGDRGD